jgi:hypothetical protein
MNSPIEQANRRPKMSQLLKNKTLLILPVAFSILIVIGILVS